MFSHLFINRIKILLRSKEIIFWTLLFPIALATFFNMAFSNLGESEIFEPINIAVVEENLSQEFRYLLYNLSQDNDDRIFNITYVETEEKAVEKLKNNEIIGYYISNETIDIVVSRYTFGQIIMKNVVDSYYQISSVIKTIMETNQNFDMSLLNFDRNFFVDNSNKNNDFTIIYFYTLIGMVCLFAGYFGMEGAMESEANLRKRAARFSIAPIHKLKGLIASLLAGFVIAYAEMLVLLAFLMFVLGISFGDQNIYILLLTVNGIFAGLALGTLIGVSNRKSEGTKSGILSAVTMMGSFLAGMMVWNMKYIIETYAPIVNRINPVAIITDGLYSLYYFDDLARYTTNMINLVIISVIMVICSYFFIRRKKYDSI